MNADKVAGGCLVSFVCWAITLYVIFALTFGDSFSDATHVCPTAREQRITLVEILTAALSINAALIFLIKRERSGSSDENDHDPN